MLYSVGANATHGLPRSNADKRRAVETLLRDDEWAQWSDSEIARRAAVSQPFVGKVRGEVAPTHNGYESPATRKGADGRTIHTANIGRRAEPSVEAPAPKPARHVAPPVVVEVTRERRGEVRDGAPGRAAVGARDEAGGGSLDSHWRQCTQVYHCTGASVRGA